eukprot:XP_008663825.1 uncharacterized protein LOC103642290 [Zea mays]
MADKVTVIPPRDPWPFSTVTVEDLQALVTEGLLRPLSDGTQPEWLAPGSKADPTPPPGKRRQGLAGLAPSKALKTGSASAAGVAARHAGWLAFAQGALRRGAQAAQAAMGQASRVEPPVGAAVIPGEAIDAAVAPSPPILLPAPASAPARAVADSPAELPVTADVETAEAPPPLVIPDLPIFDHEEGAAVVAEVGACGHEHR